MYFLKEMNVIIFVCNTEIILYKIYVVPSEECPGGSGPLGRESPGSRLTNKT